MTTKITATTPAFRAGQRALRETLSVRCEPNWRLARLIGPEFFLGFQSEWDDLTLYETLDFQDERVVENAARRLAEED